MSAHMNTIKKKLASVHAIRKITNSMYLVALAKLQKHQKRIGTIKTYAKLTQAHIMRAIQAAEHNAYVDHIYIKPAETITKAAYIVFASDVGLCGGYNVAIIRQLKAYMAARPQEKTDVFVVGKLGAEKAVHAGMNVTGVFSGSIETLSYLALCDMVTTPIIEAFNQRQYDAIRLAYTEYINPLKQEVVMQEVIPFSITSWAKDESLQQDMLFDPSPETVLTYLFEKHILSSVYIAYLEAQTSEEAMRRLAMENANSNAEDVTNTLQLAYNRERQSSITQEMSEIIGGSESVQ